MNVRRRDFIQLVGIPVLSTIAGYARAEDYPSRPVRVLVGFAPGFTPDVVTRLVAQSISEKFGQNFVVENRPGAGSNIAAEALIRSAPDGYTLFAITTSNPVNATLYQGLNFDIVADIAAIAGTYRSPDILAVTPSLPVETVPEFLAYAKAHPGQISYASAGYGTASNIAGELFKQIARVNLVHVPYKESFLPDLLSGQVQATFSPVATLISHIRDGKLRALAISSANRIEMLPNVPTVAEFVPGYEIYVWSGIVAPKNAPQEIIAKLNKEINASLAEAQVKDKLAALGAEPFILSSSDFSKYIADETKKWAAVVRAANIKVD